MLAKEADAARARRQKREAEATLEERVVLNAQQKEAARELTRKEVRTFPLHALRSLTTLAFTALPRIDRVRWGLLQERGHCKIYLKNMHQMLARASPV